MGFPPACGYVVENERGVCCPHEESLSQPHEKERRGNSKGVFVFKLFERDHSIRSDVGETPIERGHGLIIQRWTIHISGAAKIVQKTLCLLVRKPVDQHMKLLLCCHNLIVALFVSGQKGSHPVPRFSLSFSSRTRNQTTKGVVPCRTVG